MKIESTLVMEQEHAGFFLERRLVPNDDGHLECKTRMIERKYSLTVGKMSCQCGTVAFAELPLSRYILEFYNPISEIP